MSYSSEGLTTTGKVIMAGIAGFLGWRAIGPKGRDRVVGILDMLAEVAAANSQRQQELEAAERQKAQMNPFLQIPTVSAQEPTPLAIELPSTPTIGQPDLEVAIEKMMRGLRSNPIVEPDAKWRSVVAPPAVVLIVGKRGSGKSALAYRLLELFRYKLTPHIVGVGSKARKYLPDWIGIALDLNSLPINTIALVDEAYLPYDSRRSMAKQSMAMSQVLNLSRQRNQTLIFVTQEARQIDRNIASSATVIVFKEMGMLQPEFDRPELRKLVGQAKDALESVKGDKRRWSYVYSPDADFVGLLENELASF